MTLPAYNQIFSKIETAERILDFLSNREGYVSGEEISRHLGISRQLFFQQINDLKSAGYDIAAVPHLGYRLDLPLGRLFPFEVKKGLNTKFIGRKIYYLERCSSTMDIAMQLVRGNPAEGTVILAESQTKGRGRLGRHWISPKYKGIYFSLMLKPEVAPSQAAVLTLLAAVSVCEAVNSATGISCAIKWPNDILFHNKKLGGILTELEAELDRVNFVTIGIGLNVNTDAGELLRTATSLKIASPGHEEINRVKLLREILRKIEDNYFLFRKKGAAPVLDKWKSFNVTLGQRVKISFPKGHVEGRAAGIDFDGGLLVRQDNGITRKFMSGDVTHLTRNLH
ncbi:MAG: biotin--[acetyl-CoA-carboxylase] ligase [Candidatus Omnitrophota bacterium]